MLTTKTYIKKTKVGNYLRNVEEHYLRDDLFCGFSLCQRCYQGPTYLSPQHENKCSLFKFNHYLVLDTNIILNQMDILDEKIIGNVIIPHTVLQEVKHKSMPIYKRLMAVVENSSRHFYLFDNDHHKDCYLEQDVSESVNDYNDRCIRKTCTYYSEHLPNENFVLLSNDVNNRNMAKEEGIMTCSIEDYVMNLEHSVELQDKLARHNFHSESGEDLFPPHLTLPSMRLGIKENTLVQGTYRASRDNFLEGYVNVESLEDSVIVQGRVGQNRAVDGDIVVIKLLPKTDWVAPTEIVFEDEGKVDTSLEEIIKKENELKHSKSKKTDRKPTGHIVGIIRRKWKQYCGILQGDNADTATRHLFVPANKNIPKIRIETRQAAILKTQKIIVAIDDWSIRSRYPNGHFVRALGKIGEQATENEVVLLENDVPHSQFSEEVLKCLPRMPWVITDEDVEKRVDLRNIDICSVDPPGCTDIDDALHCRPLNNGCLEVGVHIADVSHFIRPGTALDKESASRATTVYLVNKRIDMVPDLLSSNLCSLRGDEERFAFSCIWVMDHKANILSTRWHKSIIKSRCALTYEEAQFIIDDKNKNDSIAFSLRNLNKFAKILKKRRLENGALVLASPEVKIQMDSETMEPIDVEVKKLFETNSMVEEFMLLANISVAEKILEDFPDCAMLRRHPEPPTTNFEPLIKAAKHLGFDIKVDTGKNLATSLDECVHENNVYFNTMLRILATRCMLQAVYFPSGMYQRDDFCHYGLAVPLYTHFTSPIRRYADIIVHRLLAVAVGADVTYPDLLDKRKTSALCQNLNYRNRMAQYAGRASVAFNTHLFFRGKIQDEEGYVLSIRKNAIQILIPRYGLETRLYLAQKGEKSLFEYNEEDQTQQCGDVILHSFDPVTVRLSLDSQNIQHEKFVLQLVKPYIEGFSVQKLPSMQQKRSVETDFPKQGKKSKKRNSNL